MGRVEVYTEFRLEHLKDRGRVEDPGVYGSVMLKWVFRKRDGGMGCIDVAQERDRW